MKEVKDGGRGGGGETRPLKIYILVLGCFWESLDLITSFEVNYPKYVLCTCSKKRGEGTDKSGKLHVCKVYH